MQSWLWQPYCSAVTLSVIASFSTESVPNIKSLLKLKKRWRIIFQSRHTNSSVWFGRFLRNYVFSFFLYWTIYIQYILLIKYYWQKSVVIYVLPLYYYYPKSFFSYCRYDAPTDASLPESYKKNSEKELLWLWCANNLVNINIIFKTSTWNSSSAYGLPTTW